MSLRLNSLVGFGPRKIFEPQGPVGTINHVFSAADSADSDVYSYAGADFGVGGKLILMLAAQSMVDTEIDSWTADGVDVDIVSGTVALTSTGAVYLGTVDVGAATSGTIIINLANPFFRMSIYVWNVLDINLVPISITATEGDHNLTYGTIPANGVAVAVAYNWATDPMGVTGLDDHGGFVFDTAVSHAASRAFTEEQTDYDVTFTGQTGFLDATALGASFAPE